MTDTTRRPGDEPLTETPRTTARTPLSGTRDGVPEGSTGTTRRPGDEPPAETPGTTTGTPLSGTRDGVRDGVRRDDPLGDPRRDTYEKGARAGVPDRHEGTGGTPDAHTLLDERRDRHGGDRALEEAHGSRLLRLDDGEKFSERLQHAVAGFVDTPRDSVAEADRVLEELAARFTDAVTERRRTLRRSWRTEDVGEGPNAAETGTEQLRLALRDYRELAERLLRA
ncbi:MULTISPECIES: hypothetical protein [unclassified Streptomyces]|uniref:hypothetical protein n=1 Tax=unclassified Streptomyces TaxID=2593676 RepID=UPI0007ECF349|nr:MULTISPECIES: hypothetical protein [unclassified Streptomyces]MCP3765709.1 hypothetical protein [Streptomyces sp. MAR25Y5]